MQENAGAGRDAHAPRHPGVPRRFLHERVLATCAEQQVSCIDLLPEFARVKDRLSLWVTPLDAHPSILANRIAADAVLATAAQQWGH